LHTQRMTMEGALMVLNGQPVPPGEKTEAPTAGRLDSALLTGIVQELKEIRDALSPRPEGEART
ncbi:MAG: hypothetical protein IKS68_04865, partial [Mailhella sp.]|nr:hypothetical protein [Mailhella sp.]